MTAESQRIRVGFDDQIFVAQPRGGISKYFVELFERLPDHGIEPVVLSTGTRNLHLAESGRVPTLTPRSRVAERLTWASWRAFGHPDTTPAPMPPIDVMHHTFTHGSYLRRWRGPRVVTVFDMTPEIFPELFPLGNPHFAKKRYVEVSDATIAISHNTANDMTRFYGETAVERTTIIPFGVGEQFFEQTEPTMDLPDRSVLFVGVRQGYKDFATALEAFRLVAADDPGLALIVVGGGPFTTAESKAIDEAGVKDRVTRLQPSDAQMPEVYRRSSVFVFPSIYEGFGLPTLESLASGTPTILADASCSREVGGDAARYFEPGSASELAATIREAFAPDEARRVASAGPARAAEFDWDRVAEATADLYRSLV